jgi:hypothetical protein
MRRGGVIVGEEICVDKTKQKTYCKRTRNVIFLSY